MNSQFLSSVTGLLLVCILASVLCLFSGCNGNDSPLLLRFKRGAAYAGGHSASRAPKLSTFAALGTYGGFDRNGHRPSKVTVANALGMYGGYLGHKGPIQISSGGYGRGGSLFNKGY